MRWLLAVTCLGVLTPPPSGAAQGQTPASRFFLALGPAWSGWRSNMAGFHLRTEYYLTRRDRAVSLRAEAGSRWTPTQSFSIPTILYGDGSRYEGMAQSTDLTLGVTASVTPWPTGRFSPYLVTGVAAVQSWTRSQGYYRAADGGLAAPVSPPLSSTWGRFAGVMGVGLRTRFGNHSLQLEARRIGTDTRAITLGTALRF
jgi:hypothetical protein